MQPREQGISDTPIREKGPEATVSTGQLHKEIIYEKGEFLAVRNTDDGFFVRRLATYTIRGVVYEYTG